MGYMLQEQLVSLPDHRPYQVATRMQQRFLSGVVTRSFASQIPAEELATQTLGMKYRGWREQLLAMYQLARRLNPGLERKGWSIIHQVNPSRRYDGDWGAYFIKPVPGENGYYPYVTLLQEDDLLTIEDGRTLHAKTLQGTDSVVSFGRVLTQVYERPLRFGVSREAYHAVTAVIADHNQISPEADWVQPIVVERDMFRNWLVPANQQGRLSALLQQSAQVEELLPFGLSEREMEAIKQGNHPMAERIRGRILSFGIRLTISLGQEISLEEAHSLVSSTMGYSSTWDVLLKSELPVGVNSEFQRMFRTAILRRLMNRHRDQQRVQNREERLGKPFAYIESNSNMQQLKVFFTEHPIDDPLTKDLLSNLSELQREVFLSRYIYNKSYEDLASELEISLTSAGNFARYAAGTLLTVLDKPKEQWRDKSLSAVATRLKLEFTDFYDQSIQNLSGKRGLYMRVLDQNKGEMTSEEMAEYFGTTPGAVKAVLHRARVTLAKRAIKEGVLEKSDVKL